LPVYLILVDPTDDSIYWQVVNYRTIQHSSTGKWYIDVPRENTISTVLPSWEAATDTLFSDSQNNFELNLSYLPPSTRESLLRTHVENPDESALLAAHLAQGRKAPDLTVLTLLHNRPTWLDTIGVDGWTSIGNFAANHGLQRMSSEAYHHGAEAALESQLRDNLLTAAGTNLTTIDSPAASAILAEVGQSTLRLEIAIALSNDPDATLAAGSLPNTLQQKIDNFDGDDDYIVKFRASQLAYQGHYSAAIRSFEKVLKADPHDSILMTDLAESLGRRSQTPDREPGDYSRAISLVRAALDQVRRWSGPTERHLDSLIRLLLMAGNWGAVLKEATVPPTGNATPDEAERTSVKVAASEAAYVLGDRALAQKIADSLPDSNDKRLLQLFREIGESSNPSEQQVAALLDVLERATDDHPEIVSDAVSFLASLGINRSERLTSLVESGIVSAKHQKMTDIIATGYADPASGIFALRAEADSQSPAARHLVLLYMQLDQSDLAVAACQRAAERFNDPKFGMMLAGILAELGRRREARDVAQSLLADPDLNGTLARRAHELLAQLAGYDGRWADAERHLIQALHQDPSHSHRTSTVWDLVVSQLNQRANDRALRTIERFEPDIPNVAAARIWLTVMHAQPITVQFASTLLELALRFEEDAQLSGQLLTLVATRTRDEDAPPASELDQRPALSDDIRRQAFDALNDHVERHGEASAIRIIRFDSPDEAVENISQYLRRDDRQIGEFVDLTRMGRLPLGLLAEALGRSYTYMLAQRALGFYLVAGNSEAEADSDATLAASAIGRTVVVDSAALLISGLLDDFERLRGNFAETLMPHNCYDDIRRAQMDLDGNSGSSGFIRWSSVINRPVLEDANLADQICALRRMDTLRAGVRNVTLRPVENLEHLSDFDSERSGAWLAPFELAIAEGCALWSDDPALRLLANHFDVESFSTLGLLEHLFHKDIDRLLREAGTEAVGEIIEARRATLHSAFELAVADVPITHEDRLTILRSRDFTIDLAYASVGRPSWWTWSDNPWQELDSLLLEVVDSGGSNLANGWRAAAMHGACLLDGVGSSRAPVVIAAIAILGNPSGSDMHEALLYGSRLSRRVEVSEPRPRVMQAAVELKQMGLLDDPDLALSKLIEFESGLED